MQKFKMAAIGLLFVPTLVGCATSPGAQKLPECTVEGNHASGCKTTLQYKGKPIDCITWDGSHGETGLTCDFVKYHQER